MNIDFPPPSNGTYNNAGSSRRLADYCEHEDLDNHVGIYADKQEEIAENNQSINQEDKKENKCTSNLPDLGLSSALGLFTPNINSSKEQQTTMKKKIKKKPKRGFRR